MRKGWAKPTCVIAIVVLTLAGRATGARADDPVPSNLELMNGLATAAMEELLSKVPPGINPREVSLLPYAEDERYEFLNHAFTRVLTTRGYKTYAVGSIAAGDTLVAHRDGRMVLEYQATNFSLTYRKIYRAYLFGGRRVRRQADIQLYARFLDPSDDSIVWVGEARRSNEDQFSYGKLSQVEQGSFTFNKPPRPTTNWGKIVEPVVVSGIIVGLIYLFFSNQTD